MLAMYTCHSSVLMALQHSSNVANKRTSTLYVSSRSASICSKAWCLSNSPGYHLLTSQYEAHTWTCPLVTTHTAVTPSVEDVLTMSYVTGGTQGQNCSQLLALPYVKLTFSSDADAAYTTTRQPWLHLREKSEAKPASCTCCDGEVARLDRYRQ